MVGYNITSIANNATSMVGLTQGVNEVLMKSQLGTLFLIGFFVIVLMGFYFSTRDVPKSLAGASFIIFILALLLRAVSLIDSIVLYTSLILSAAIIAFTFRK